MTSVPLHKFRRVSVIAVQFSMQFFHAVNAFKSTNLSVYSFLHTFLSFGHLNQPTTSNTLGVFFCHPKVIFILSFAEKGRGVGTLAIFKGVTATASF